MNLKSEKPWIEENPQTPRGRWRGSGPWIVSPIRAGNIKQAPLHIDKDQGERQGKGTVLPELRREEIKGLNGVWFGKQESKSWSSNNWDKKAHLSYPWDPGVSHINSEKSLEWPLLGDIHHREKRGMYGDSHPTEGVVGSVMHLHCFHSHMSTILINLCLWVWLICLCVCMSTVCVPGVVGVQKKVLDPLRLELRQL